MFSKIRIIIIPLIFCCALIGGCSGNNYNLTEQSGDVFYNSSRAGSGTVINDGDTIATGINSFAVLSCDDSRIFLFPESTIIISDVNKPVYSLSSGEAVFVNNNYSSAQINNDSTQLKMAGKSVLSILRSGDYSEICVMKKAADLLTGDKKLPLIPGARSTVFNGRLISSKPLSMIEMNKLLSMTGVTGAEDLKRFYVKRDNLPGSKLVNLYLNNGALKQIKTRNGKVIVGTITVTGNSAVIKTENGEVKLKTGEIQSVQSYDKF